MDENTTLDEKSKSIDGYRKYTVIVLCILLSFIGAFYMEASKLDVFMNGIFYVLLAYMPSQALIDFVGIIKGVKK